LIYIIRAAWLVGHCGVLDKQEGKPTKSPHVAPIYGQVGDCGGYEGEEMKPTKIAQLTLNSALLFSIVTCVGFSFEIYEVPAPPIPSWICALIGWSGILAACAFVIYLVLSVLDRKKSN